MQSPPMLKLVIPIAILLTSAVSHAGGEFRHVVMFKFKDSATPEQVAAVEKAFGELPAKIDAIVDFEWGTSASADGRDNGFTHCVFMTFKDKAGLEAYLPHPAHVAFKETSLPVIEKLMVIDYVAKD